MTARDRLAALPEFPQLAPIAPEHLSAIRAFNQCFDSYSDFNATSLWGWAAAVPGGYLVGRLGDNLVVEFGDYLTGERFYSILGDDNLNFACSELIRHASTSGLTPELRLVPEVSTRQLDSNKWRVEYDRDSFDYIIDLVELAGLSGGRYSRLRKSFTRFSEEMSGRARFRWCTAAELADLSASLLTIYDSWAARGSEGAATSDQERRAFQHVITSAESAAPGMSDLSGVCFVDDIPMAVCLNDPVTEDEVSGHYQKVADGPGSRDLERWLDILQARHFVSMGFRYMNIQQDLGIVGLRRAKTELGPARFLRKATVQPRSW